MAAFTMELQDSTHFERVSGVVSFVGESPEGQFGLMASHVRMMTMLSFGLSRYRLADGEWRYLALPGGLLYFLDNTLIISTSQFFVGDDKMMLAEELEKQLKKEASKKLHLKESLKRLEQEMFRRLWSLGNEPTG